MGVIIPLTNPQYPSYTYLDIRKLYKDNAEDSKMMHENDSEPEMVQAGISNCHLKITSKSQSEIRQNRQESRY